MPDYLSFQKSISDELLSIKDRVRNFIDDNHWGEDGRYKEIILQDVLKNYLPICVSIGTGFVMGEDKKVSTQIDIIVYRNDVPVLFKKETFVIVPKESVLGIIEVKTKLESGNIEETLKKSHYNGQLIERYIFNGIFGYETEFAFNNSITESLKLSLYHYHGYINNVSFGKDIFMKYWIVGQPNTYEQKDHFSFYKIEDLSFGYFISNMIEDVYIQLNNTRLPKTIHDSLYPIENTKERYRMDDLDLKIGLE